MAGLPPRLIIMYMQRYSDTSQTRTISEWWGQGPHGIWYMVSLRDGVGPGWDGEFFRRRRPPLSSSPPLGPRPALALAHLDSNRTWARTWALDHLDPRPFGPRRTWAGVSKMVERISSRDDVLWKRFAHPLTSLWSRLDASNSHIVKQQLKIIIAFTDKFEFSRRGAVLLEPMVWVLLRQLPFN